jgi:hypothetical protein
VRWGANRGSVSASCGVVTEHRLSQSKRAGFAEVFKALLSRGMAAEAVVYADEAAAEAVVART